MGTHSPVPAPMKKPVKQSINAIHNVNSFMASPPFIGGLYHIPLYSRYSFSYAPMDHGAVLVVPSLSPEHPPHSAAFACCCFPAEMRVSFNSSGVQWIDAELVRKTDKTRFLSTDMKMSLRFHTGGGESFHGHKIGFSVWFPLSPIP